MSRRAGRAWPAALAAAALLAVGLGHAGSDLEPEVQDRVGDAKLPAGTGSSVQGTSFPDTGEEAATLTTSLRSHLDITHAFFEPGPMVDDAHLVLALQGGGNGTLPCSGCAWVVAFQWGDRALGVYRVYRQGPENLQGNETVGIGVREGTLPSAVFPYRPLEGLGVEATYIGDFPRYRFRLSSKELWPDGRANFTATFAETLFFGGDQRWHQADRGPDCPKKDVFECQVFGRDYALTSEPGANTTATEPTPQASEYRPGPGSAQSASGPNATRGDANATEYAGAEALNATDAGAPLERTAAPGSSDGAGATLLGPGLDPGGVLMPAIVGMALLTGTTVVVQRTRPSGRLARRIEAVPKTHRTRPEAGQRELDRLAKECQDAFSRGWISRRALLRLQARVGRARKALVAPAGAAVAQAAATVANAQRYRFVGALPVGSFGRAHIAFDSVLQRKVVIKQLHPEWRLDPKAKAGFLREARIAGHLNHPHIVTVYDIDHASDALIMEFVEGGSLEERLRRGPLAPADALRLCDEVLQGLERVHAEGIYHRDLKPANILLTRDGHAKIADFGIAHAPADQGVRFSASGHQPGTPLYMAPEQVLNDPPDASTDLYALSAVLHEMLTGVHYLGATVTRDFELRRAIVEQAPRLDPRLPEPLRRFLSRALAKERAQRFRDAAEMRAALARLAGRSAPGGP